MWDIKNISDLETFDFSTYDQDSKDTVRKSNDGLFFLVSSGYCTDHTSEQIEEIMLSDNWKSINNFL